MSDASLIAGELQDVAAAIGDVVAAVRTAKSPDVTVNVPPTSPPDVIVNLPAVQAPDVIVNLPASVQPDVHVAAPSIEFKPQITIPPPLPAPPSGYEVVITERDANGFIYRFVITPT